MPNLGSRRPVIGVLPAWPMYIDEMPDHYSAQIIHGIFSQARASNCDLLLAMGIGRLAWPSASPSSDFIPIGHWNTDGLIVFTPLADEKRSAYIQQIQASGHPVIFIAAGEEGPSIQVDNAGGIREAIFHLAEHGHRRIAFIAGSPVDPGDTVMRLEAYRQALTECGLEYRSSLVAYGWHIENGGYDAMKQILASGESFSAVQASNDASAIGALWALREAGLQVPGQVALIGFDDQPDASAQVPALTSVHTPLQGIGANAVESLAAWIREGKPLQSRVLPASLERRVSCGCLPDAMLHVSAPVLNPLPAGNQPLERHEILSCLKQALALSPTDSGEAYARLAPALLASVQTGETSSFDLELRNLLLTIERNNGDITALQDVLSRLRQAALGLAQRWPAARVNPLVEELFQRARVALVESLRFSNFRYRYSLENNFYRFSLLSAHLSGCLNPRHMVNILEEDLPKIGIRHARLLLFEPSAEDAYAGSRRISPDSTTPSVEDFPTRQFPPPGLYPEEDPLSLALVPLNFQGEPMGYIAFDSGQLDALPPISRQVSANLKAAHLHAEVTELSLNDELTSIPNRRYLELFLHKEIARHHRFQHKLSIVMVDIDDFKTYNDTFGHLSGDQALKVAAQCLQDHLREADMVARYGGDEFILALAETDEPGALAVTEHIRTSMAAQTSLIRPVTLSMGIATSNGSEDTLEQLIARADHALYQAKNEGKDRARVSKA